MLSDGARFENLVYLALRRGTKDISYFDDDGECDFILRSRRIDVVPFWDWHI